MSDAMPEPSLDTPCAWSAVTPEQSDTETDTGTRTETDADDDTPARRRPGDGPERLAGAAALRAGRLERGARPRHLRDRVVVHDGVGDAVLICLQVVHVDLLRQRARLQDPGRLRTVRRTHTSETRRLVARPDAMAAHVSL